MFLSLHFRFFCFGISELDFFYLSALLECCLSVLAESEGCRIILLLFVSHFISKNPKTFSYHHALHFAFLHCTCTRFSLEYYLGLHIKKYCIHHLKKICAFHVVEYPVFMNIMHLHWLLGVHFTSCCVITPLVAWSYMYFE